MIPVKQTKFGPVEGNCFAACIASLLEKSIEEVPIDLAAADNWWPSIQAYLRPMNMYMYFLEVRIDVATSYPFYAMDGIMCVMSGNSPRVRGMNHCVVGMINATPEARVQFNILHDPHPDNTGLATKSIWGLGFIIKLNPAKP